MDVQYTADPVDLDKPVYDVATERPGKPIRVRLQPLLLRGASEHGRGSDYVSWKGVSWTVGCATPEEAIVFRQALEVFFAAVSTRGLDDTILRLTDEVGGQ